jgi:hypothetical protein
MRKCSYWFSLLSKKEQKEYKENAKSDWDIHLEHEEEDFAGFIGCGFIWEYTPQGHEYWSKISQRTNHNRGNFLTRLLRGIGLRA